MNIENIQEILSRVEMPSRYLGTEVNTVHKNPDEMDLTIGLAFPDLYEIGTSHFGLQILYSILNQRPDIAAERFFTPSPDMEETLLDMGLPLFSMESRRPMTDFDVIGFSLLYELNFTNILTMLHLSGIPFFARDRGEDLPLVIAGGPCAFNPEPLADFFDLFVIGDGETVIQEIADRIIQWKPSSDTGRQALLKELAGLPGVYVPTFFDVRFDEKGIQHTTPLAPYTGPVRRAVLPDLSPAGFPRNPIVPFGKPVHDRLRLEIARGCSRGCRFCQAGMIYRPVRERPVSELVDIAENTLDMTGYSDISLLSLSTGDYSRLAQLMSQLMALNPGHCTAISLPSIRAGRLTPELMEIIRKVKKTGFTIAPEAGTQRLRDVINKNITEADIFDTVQNAFELGWQRIKLYFMNGLPTETREDILGICDLVLKLAAIKIKGKKRPTITVSFATFIPKAHTPFQRCSQILPEQSKTNLQILKDTLKHPGVNIKWQDPWMSFLEGVWARGDRRLSRVLVTAWEMGCRLDGWSDRFDMATWHAAFEKNDIDPYFYTTRTRDAGEPLPWSHIDSGISERYLETEYRRALDGRLTPDCRETECTGCGICDFKTVSPVLHSADTGRDDTPSKPAPPAEHFMVCRCFYTRLGDTRHFGHLELAKIIRRAIRRTGVRVKYSQGFNPTMKLAFDNPLPVGMESEAEFFTFHVHVKTDIDRMKDRLNRGLPPGLAVTCCVTGKQQPDPDAEAPTTYEVRLPGHRIPPDLIAHFMAQPQFEVTRTNHKGKVRTTDLRKAVRCLELLDPHHLKIVLNRYQGRIIRPADVLTAALGVPEEVMDRARTLKRRQNGAPC